MFSMISDMKTKHTHIPVRVNGVSDGEYQSVYELDPKEIELPEQFAFPLHVRVDVDKRNAQAVLSILADTQAVFPCDRCLEPIYVPVRTQFKLFYVRDAETAQLTNEEEEVKDVDPGEPVIDITADVVDSRLVNGPMRKVCEEFNPENTLCREPEEPAAGEGDSIDPRWEALKKLKDDN